MDRATEPAAGKGKPRPALFRALGKKDPPTGIVVAGRPYRRVEIFKHDSWAATALYTDDVNTLVCKFNRIEPILGLPTGWLGQWLADREAYFYRTLADLPGIPAGCGPIHVDGAVMPNAVGHAFVDGRPLKESDRLPPSFFDDLRQQLAVIHERGIAYMDLHKRENIILGSDGRGYLIDFQVSMRVSPESWLAPARWLVNAFQQGDQYHLAKHQLRLGQSSPEEMEKMLDAARPTWIRAHRIIAQPLRALRRRLLVALGIRKGLGKAQSEHFTEDGLLAETTPRRAA